MTDLPIPIPLVASHHLYMLRNTNQKWFMIALIHGPSSEQHFFLNRFSKCFLMFLAKCKRQTDVERLSGFFSKRIVLAYASLLLEKKY